MARKFTPEELLDAEIDRLKQTEAVKLAQKEQRILNRKRKYLVTFVGLKSEVRH